MSRHDLGELGLDKNADERAVKRAYAERLRSRRPDEDAVDFQKLHEAYTRALAFVRNRAGARANSTSIAIDQPRAWNAPRQAPLEPASRPPDEDSAPPGNSTSPTESGSGGREHSSRPPGLDLHQLMGELQDAWQLPAQAFRQWLQSRDELYSINGRTRLIPSLLHTLESTASLPTLESFDALLAFFGLDQVDRRSLHLQHRLEMLKDKAHRQHMLQTGPDLSFMFDEKGASTIKVKRQVHVPVLPIILAIFLASTLVKCLTAPDRPLPLDGRPSGRAEQPWSPGASRPATWRFDMNPEASKYPARQQARPNTYPPTQGPEGDESSDREPRDPDSR